MRTYTHQYACITTYIHSYTIYKYRYKHIYISMYVINYYTNCTESDYDITDFREHSGVFHMSTLRKMVTYSMALDSEFHLFH